jgi:hypothetical protein
MEMADRSKSEIQTAFVRVAEQLDNNLEAARSKILQAGLEIQDHSNRSGFDWVGPYFLWEFWFEHREQSQNAAEIISKRAKISYLEPWKVEEPKITLEWTVEIFQLGQQSRVKKSKTENLSLECVLRKDMSLLVFDLISKAKAELTTTA